jgi:hypothetical protein
MSLRNRLRRLEGTTGQQQCPEHWAPVTPALPVDYRALLAPFSPDPGERARYEAERQAQRCARCGWEPVQIVASADWPNQGRGGLGEPASTLG